jgi:hypothetical protein
MEYTLTYSEQVDGFPSFYSFMPESMIGMNNYFYSFKGGNLYRHNVNPLRNTFYYDWWAAKEEPAMAFSPSTMKSVFNDSPLENKLFKTLTLQGDDSWEAHLTTDIQNTGFVDANWFEKKEQAYFSFIRNEGTTPATPNEYALRSTTGIGKSISASGSQPAVKVEFSITPLVSIGSIISIGDYAYFAEPPYETLQFAGRITSINQNLKSGDNYITIDATLPDTVYPIPIQDAYFVTIKSIDAEINGVLGHYCEFEISNYNTSKVELFQIQSEVMKSFP